MDMGANSEYQHRQDALIITAVVMTVVASTFVIMRLISRFIVIHNSGPDDFFMLGAVTFTICYVIMLFILGHNRIGYPMKTLTPDNMVAFIKTTLAIQVMYYANVFCIKTSILITYLRFAITKTFRMLCYGTIALHAVFFFICLIVTLAQCQPLQKMWDFTGAVSGNCINTTAFFYSTSAFNILTDIWILGLPFKTLRSIQRPRREKIALFLIFGVGTFAVIASIVRLHTIRIYTQSDDPFRDGIPVNLWSIIEVTVAIACASVPALKPIFSRRQRAASRAAKSTSTGLSMQYTQSYLQSHLETPTRTQTYLCEPPQTYAARHARMESDASAREKLAASLGFHAQDTRPPVDREQSESSGMSLGLPLQRPLQPPPPTVRTVSQQSATCEPAQWSFSPQPQRSRTSSSQASTKSAVRPQPLRKSSSQRSVTVDAGGSPVPSRNASHTSINRMARPAIPPRTASQRSTISARPQAPSRNSSQRSFLLE